MFLTAFFCLGKKELTSRVERGAVVGGGTWGGGGEGGGYLFCRRTSRCGM